MVVAVVVMMMRKVTTAIYVISLQPWHIYKETERLSSLPKIMQLEDESFQEDSKVHHTDYAHTYRNWRLKSSDGFSIRISTLSLLLGKRLLLMVTDNQSS